MVIRARDVRVLIKDYGFEKGVVAALEQILDEYVQTREHLRELTELCSHCIDQVEKMVHVGDALKLRVEELKRISQQGDHHGDQS